MDAPSPLLQVVDAYAEALGIPDTTISSRVFDDGKKIAALRDGKEITMGRYAKALRWFSENWPENSEWPDAVDRPLTHEQSENAA